MDGSIDSYGAAGLGVSKQWENDILRQIAMKLAPLPDDMSFIYAMFARNQKVVTKQRFVEILQSTFKLEVQERELDIFMRSNPVLKGKDYIDQEDFITVFSYPISQARKEIQMEKD